MFGNPPDETAFFRLMLNREAVAGAMLMIQPQLYQYSMEQDQPVPVPLDIASGEMRSAPVPRLTRPMCPCPSTHPAHVPSPSVIPDRILLMDSYFMVAIEYGKTVATWRKVRAGAAHNAMLTTASPVVWIRRRGIGRGERCQQRP